MILIYVPSRFHRPLKHKVLIMGEDETNNLCAGCGNLSGQFKYCLKCLDQWYDPADLNGPDRQMILEQRLGYTPAAYQAGKIIEETFRMRRPNR